MIKVILLLAAVFGLSSCASWYDVSTNKSAIYQQPLQIESTFNISGRFIIKTKVKDYYGNFNWQHDNESDNLVLMSPLGTTAASIKLESGIVTLNTENEQYQGVDVDKLMQDKLGFILPLNYLHYWVQGVPLVNYPVSQKLVNGFKQLGWNVEYLTWLDHNHPSLVQLTTSQLKIKLVINWSGSEDN